MFDASNLSSAAGLFKRAASTVMQQIVDERPEHWPDGCEPEMFDDLRLINHAGKLAGFVGWQSIDTDQGKVGFISVGLLPEFRGKGIAKKACQEIIQDNKSKVSTVVAAVESSNAPSLGLVKSLGLKVYDFDTGKIAAKLPPAVAKFLTGRLAFMGAGAAASALENKYVFDNSDSLDKTNLLLGAVTGLLLKNKKTRYPALAAWPVKQMGLLGVGAYQKDAPLRHETARLNLESARLDSPGLRNAALAALGISGLGATGIYAYDKLGDKPTSRPRGGSGTGEPPKRKEVITMKIPTSEFTPEIVQNYLERARKPVRHQIQTLAEETA
jgi:ribosomal protein S18 acetylase RimI-like enzyme